MDDRTRDELAGVVDLFGGLTRDELADALLELAFKGGQDVDEAAVEPTIADAIEDYYLVEIPAKYILETNDDHPDETATDDGRDTATESASILVPGPAAFPTLPDGATDLPHILDAPRRSLDREVLGASIVNQLQAEAGADHVDADRAQYLIDVTYDAETWANVDLSNVRDTLESRTDGGS